MRRMSSSVAVRKRRPRAWNPHLAAPAMRIWINRQETLARACSQRHVLPAFCALKLHHSASTERLSRLHLPPLEGTLEASGWMRRPHQEMEPSLLVQLGLASAAVLGDQRWGQVAPPEIRTDMSVGMGKL
jgi:hypothetical protein